jgi:4-azaleucine resistance transporter AzlC
VSDSSSNKLQFNFMGLLQGVVASWPIGIAVFTYGIVFGIMSRQAGLTPFDAVIMGALVFAGASQMVAMSVWAPVLPVWTIILTVMSVNLRHVLMGAAIQPYFSRLSRFKAYGSLFFMNDESWALTMKEFKNGSTNGAFLIGSGLVVFVAWLSSTYVGQVLISTMTDPAKYGLDFAFTAVFLSLLMGMRSGKSDILPWLTAALFAMVAHKFLPGKWYILIGAVSGSGLYALINGGKSVQ